MPTLLGTAVKGPSQFPGVPGRQMMSAYTLAADGVVDTLTGWFYGTGTYRLVIYADNGFSAPGARLAYSSIKTLTGGDVLVSESGFGLALTTGTYWVGWECVSGSGGSYYSGTSGITIKGTLASATDPPPDPFSPIDYFTNSIALSVWGATAPVSDASTVSLALTPGGTESNVWVFGNLLTTSQIADGNGFKISSKFVLASPQTFTSLNAIVAPAGGTRRYVLHVYSDSAGVPGTLIANTAPITIVGNGTKQKISQSGLSIPLAAGTYWLGITTETSSGGTIYYTSGGLDTDSKSGAADFSPPSSPWGTPTSFWGPLAINVWAEVPEPSPYADVGIVPLTFRPRSQQVTTDGGELYLDLYFPQTTVDAGTIRLGFTFDAVIVNAYVEAATVRFALTPATLSEVLCHFRVQLVGEAYKKWRPIAHVNYVVDVGQRWTGTAVLDHAIADPC